jgi:predicted alpha/beta hydrolase family esterase
MKRIIFVHGWGGRVDAGWWKWLNSELKNKEFEVIALEMPNPEFPKIDLWISHMNKKIKNPDKNTFFVGHSIGCQAILRYLEQLPEKTKVGGIFCVGGWFKLNPLETDEEKEVATPWLTKQINFQNVKQKTNYIFGLFSDDDPYVPLENEKLFKEKLNAETKIEHNKGHYIENVTKTIPELLNKIMEKTK